MPDMAQLLRDYEQRFREQVDRGTTQFLELRQRGQAALDALTAALARVTALEGKANQVLARIQSDEQAFTALTARVTAAESRLTAAEAELVKLDPTYVPPTG